MFLGRETLEEHIQLPKKANKCNVGAVASFSYVWRLIIPRDDHVKETENAVKRPRYCTMKRDIYESEQAIA